MTKYSKEGTCIDLTQEKGKSYAIPKTGSTIRRIIYCDDKQAKMERRQKNKSQEAMMLCAFQWPGRDLSLASCLSLAARCWNKSWRFWSSQKSINSGDKCNLWSAEEQMISLSARKSKPVDTIP